jgi:hypothetical protein
MGMGNNLEFAGRVALIPGGNSGIGAAAARRVVELGAQVVVTKRRQSEGRLLVNDIKCNNGSAAFIGADPSPPEQVKRIVPFSTPGKERWRKERLEPPLTPCTSFDHLDLESEQGSSIH